MPDWLLRVAGVNFSATMDDTQDLSTRRGASLTLLNGCADVAAWLRDTYSPAKVETVFVGASEALFVLDAGVDARTAAESVRQLLAGKQVHAPNTPPHPTPSESTKTPVATMTFAVDVERGRDDRALERLEAKLKRRQFHAPTLPPGALQTAPDPRAIDWQVCPIEHRLPATAEHSVRKDMCANAQVVWADPDPEHDEKRILVADTVQARRSYGRSARQRFYAHLLGAGASVPAFADGFIDLVERPPETVPLPLRNKVAVIAADGIGFGKLIETAVGLAGGDRIAGLKRFSADVETMLREDLLRPLIGAFRSAHDADGDPEKRTVSIPAACADNPKARREGWSPILRFETLTYAGEDIVWLCPSWLAWDVVGFLFEASTGARIAEKVPQFRVGVAISSYKMPIRKARELAGELAYKVDDGSAEGGCQIELVESLDVSDGYLDAHRARLAGDVPASRFTIKAADFDTVAKHVKKLRHRDGLPPSQLHRLLRRAAKEGAFTSAAGRETVERDLESTLERAGYDYGGRPLLPADLALPALGAAGDLLFGLLRAAQLWDIVEPFRRPIIARPGP